VAPSVGSAVQDAAPKAAAIAKTIANKPRPVVPGEATPPPLRAPRGDS
jgi:hypothetical protein